MSYEFVCNHCESIKHPDLSPVAYFNPNGTEYEELVPHCQDCGENLDGEQRIEFFADLNGSSL
jgi:hypothetical protein